MRNPWQNIDIKDYENHMSSDTVMQLQALNEITKQQLEEYDCKTVCFFGIAGGNGLEHIKNNKYTKVFCIDINIQYLGVCKERHSYLGDRMCIIETDLSDVDALIPKTELVIANLIIEYIGIDAFVHQIKKAEPNSVSCVIQNKGVDRFVSISGYEGALHKLDSIHTFVVSYELISKMDIAGYKCTKQIKTLLPNGKSFTRLEFIKIP